MKRELHVHSAQTPAEKLRTAVEIVAIVAAGIWALYTFVYEQRIKPLSEPAEFSIPTTVDQGPTVNGVTFLTIHKRLENTGDVPIDIAAEALSVYGEKVVKSGGRVQMVKTRYGVEMRADVARKPVALLYSKVKLRSGAVDGDPNTSFYVSPHSSADAVVVVAVPARTYPAVLITRVDFIGKAPIRPKVAVNIVRSPLGGYTLRATPLEGEYDSVTEFAIAP